VNHTPKFDTVFIEKYKNSIYICIGGADRIFTPPININEILQFLLDEKKDNTTYGMQDFINIEYVLDLLSEEKYRELYEKGFAGLKDFAILYTFDKYIDIIKKGYRKIRIQNFREFLDIYYESKDYEKVRSNIISRMLRVVNIEKEVYKISNIKYSLNRNLWYSIAIRGELYLQKMKFYKYYPKVAKEGFFLDAFFGGRIEQAYQGAYRGNIYYYDINSAYPYALSQIESFKEGSLKKVKEYIPNTYGIYKIVFFIKKSYKYYPIPLRRWNKVIYPKWGISWITNFEYEKLSDNERKNIKILYGYIVEKNGINPINEVIPIIYKYRKEINDEFLKKFLASMYGKVVQNKGQSKVYNDFLGVLITGFVRAKIWEIIKDNQEIISISTDSLFSLKPVKLPISENLGDFKERIYSNGIFINQGIYTVNKDFASIRKYQGFKPNVTFNFSKALKDGIAKGFYEVEFKIPAVRHLKMIFKTNESIVKIQKKMTLKLSKRRGGGLLGIFNSGSFKKYNLTYYKPYINWLFWIPSEGYKYTEKIPYTLAESENFIQDIRYIYSVLTNYK